MNAELLANEINSLTSDLYQLEHPFRSSVSALGTNQWLSDILAQWGSIDEKNHLLIVVSALGAAQTGSSYALSCIQDQLWIQLTALVIRKKDNEGILPTEI